MKRYIILVFLASLLFGVKPVPRNNGDDKDKKTKTEKVIKTSNKPEKKEKGLTRCIKEFLQFIGLLVEGLY